MDLQEIAERVTLILTAALCIIITILDFAGALDSIPWLTQRVPVMVLLAVGLIALSLLSEGSRTVRSLSSTFSREHNDILTRLNLNQTNQVIVDQINRLWNDREPDIQRFFDEVNTIASRVDLHTLIEYLADCQRNFSQGNMLGTKTIYPWDFTIIAMDLKGKFVYHPREELISTRKLKDHHREILERRNGELFWLNNYKSLQFEQLFSDKGIKSVRLTKVYFREIEQLSFIIMFESHLDILRQLPRTEVNKDGSIAS